MIATSMTRISLAAAERGLLPDTVLRAGIRRLCARRQAAEQAAAEGVDPVARILPVLASAPIAEATEEANAQHYEVPAAFYQRVLGPHLKYSSAYWDETTRDLGEAERAALDLTLRHADLADGQDVLELGCGWGSLTLAMAERFPKARITAVSNASSQARFIRARLEERGLGNVTVVTADMNRFEPTERFDRIVSVEMFEHLRNWPRALGRVETWLRPRGRFMAHVFCHRDLPYLFEDRGASDWMARHFFSGGLMPSADLMPRVVRHLAEEEGSRLSPLETWTWSGTHYARTADAWLANLDADREACLRALAIPDPRAARRMLERWRLFFLACSELFGHDAGRDWGVVHHAFTRRA